jgi:hypothetical protein
MDALVRRLRPSFLSSFQAIDEEFNNAKLYVNEQAERAIPIVAANDIPSIPIVGDIHMIIGGSPTTILPEGTLHIPIEGREGYFPTCVKFVGDELLVLDKSNSYFDIYNIKQGTWVRQIGENGIFQEPSYGHVDANGKLYITDTINYLFKVFDYQSGRLITEIVTPKTKHTTGLTVHETTGQIFMIEASMIGDEQPISIFKLNEGNVLTQIGTIPETDNEGNKQLFNALSLHAMNDSLFVTQANDTISEFRISDGKLLRNHGESCKSNAGFQSPVDLAVYNDLLLIADCNNHAVKMLRLPELSYVGQIGKGYGEPGQLVGDICTPHGVAMNEEFIAVTGNDLGDGSNGKSRVQIFKRIAF